MTDDIGRERELAERLRALAGDYNRPAETPRERMWTAIQARRVSDRTPVRPSARPPVRQLFYWVTGVAALLAVGIGIGRLTDTAVPAPPEQTTAAAPTETKGSAPNAALTVATNQHLGRVETFLTSFRLGGTDTQFVAQARDLLTSTRLLLDSRVVENHRTRILLEDLELILVQISQLGPDGRGQELDLITDGLEQRQVMPRLRTAIPAGPARSAGAS